MINYFYLQIKTFVNQIQGNSIQIEQLHLKQLHQ